MGQWKDELDLDVGSFWMDKKSVLVIACVHGV